MTQLLVIAALLMQATGVTVSGRVISPPGQAAAFLQVALLGGNPSGVSYATVRDGKFEFPDVHPGAYTLSVMPGTLAHPINLVVANKDVADIEAVLLWTTEVTGTVAVEGDGVRPRITLSFSPFEGGVAPPTATPTNGPFKVTLPEGEYRLAWSGLPAGYQLRSIKAGSTDLLASPLKIVPGVSVPSITVTLGVSSPAWVKVSGRVTGLTAAGGPYRVSLGGTAVADALETPVNADGSFEFTHVLPGSYTARFNPALPVPAVSIVVPGKKDLSGVEIALPPLKEARVVVEALGQTPPPISFSFTDSSGSMSAALAAQPDGTFKVVLPEGEHQVTVNAPVHIVRSFTYGATDLLQNPLKLSSSDTEAFHLAIEPAVTLTEVGGGTQTTISATREITGAAIQANLISRPPLKYPEQARQARVTGPVVLSIVIAKDGTVSQLKVVSGHPLLDQAAIENVRQWKYKPYVVNGQPVEIETQVTVSFAP
jgi:TonB family protein